MRIPEPAKSDRIANECEVIAGLAAILAAATATLLAWQPTGAQLVNAGRFEDALKVFQSDLATVPESVAANNGAGVALDLMGRYVEARPYFSAAIKSGHTPLERALAERAMAIGFGFAGDCGNAEKLEKRAFEFYRETNDFPNAGDVADELARLCLDSGDFDRASEWYQRGHDTGFEEPNISAARRDSISGWRMQKRALRCGEARARSAQADHEGERDS